MEEFNLKLLENYEIGWKEITLMFALLAFSPSNIVIQKIYEFSIRRILKI